MATAAGIGTRCRGTDRVPDPLWQEVQVQPLPQPLDPIGGLLAAKRGLPHTLRTSPSSGLSDPRFPMRRGTAELGPLLAIQAAMSRVASSDVNRSTTGSTCSVDEGGRHGAITDGAGHDRLRAFPVAVSRAKDEGHDRRFCSPLRVVLPRAAMRIRTCPFPGGGGSLLRWLFVLARDHVRR